MHVILVNNSAMFQLFTLYLMACVFITYFSLFKYTLAPKCTPTNKRHISNETNKNRKKLYIVKQTLDSGGITYYAKLIFVTYNKRSLQYDYSYRLVLPTKPVYYMRQ